MTNEPTTEQTAVIRISAPWAATLERACSTVTDLSLLKTGTVLYDDEATFANGYRMVVQVVTSRGASCWTQGVLYDSQGNEAATTDVGDRLLGVFSVWHQNVRYGVEVIERLPGRQQRDTSLPIQWLSWDHEEANGVIGIRVETYGLGLYLPGGKDDPEQARCFGFVDLFYRSPSGASIPDVAHPAPVVVHFNDPSPTSEGDHALQVQLYDDGLTIVPSTDWRLDVTTDRIHGQRAYRVRSTWHGEQP